MKLVDISKLKVDVITKEGMAYSYEQIHDLPCVEISDDKTKSATCCFTAIDQLKEKSYGEKKAKV